MKTLADILIETGISYGTLIRYQDMGLVPRPEIIRHGRKGTESLYPDDVIWAIMAINVLRDRGYTVSQIRDARG